MLLGLVTTATTTIIPFRTSCTVFTDAIYGAIGNVIVSHIRAMPVSFDQPSIGMIRISPRYREISGCPEHHRAKRPSALPLVERSEGELVIQSLAPGVFHGVDPRRQLSTLLQSLNDRSDDPPPVRAPQCSATYESRISEILGSCCVAECSRILLAPH